MVITGLVSVVFGLIELVLTPIAALLNVTGLNTVIGYISDYLAQLLDTVVGPGASLAAYFFNWAVVQAVFAAWLIIVTAEKAYAIYRFIRRNGV